MDERMEPASKLRMKKYSEVCMSLMCNPLYIICDPLYCLLLLTDMSDVNPPHLLPRNPQTASNATRAPMRCFG